MIPLTGTTVAKIIRSVGSWTKDEALMYNYTSKGALTI